jgi:hypothetical protein
VGLLRFYILTKYNCAFFLYLSNKNNDTYILLEENISGFIEIYILAGFSKRLSENYSFFTIPFSLPKIPFTFIE